MPTTWINLTSVSSSGRSQPHNKCMLYFSIYKKYKNWQNYFMMLEVRMVIKPRSNVVLDRGTRWSSGGLVMPFFVCTQNLN